MIAEKGELQGDDRTEPIVVAIDVVDLTEQPVENPDQSSQAEDLPEQPSNL